MCLGLAPDRSYAGCAIGKTSKACPSLTTLVTAWARRTLPDPAFRFGSVQINFNYRARKHIDMNNLVRTVCFQLCIAPAQTRNDTTMTLGPCLPPAGLPRI